VNGRRRVVPALAIAIAISMVLVMSGCAHRWEMPLRADGAYCVPIGRGHHSTCTANPVPSLEADAAAKRFLPAPEALTVYVVRKRRDDYRNQVPVRVDDGSPIVTVPESFIRWQLRPGTHALRMEWDGHVQTLRVDGRAGEIVWVRLDGSVGSDHSTYRFERVGPELGRALAGQTRLVGDEVGSGW